MKFWGRRVYSSSADTGSLEFPPEGGWLTRWFGGVLAPALPIGYGLLAWSRGEAVLTGRGASLEFHGWLGFTLALAYVALGLFFHFHFFWGLHPRLVRASGPAKLAAGVVFVVSLCVVLGSVVKSWAV